MELIWNHRLTARLAGVTSGVSLILKKFSKRLLNGLLRYANHCILLYSISFCCHCCRPTRSNSSTSLYSPVPLENDFFFLLNTPYSTLNCLLTRPSDYDQLFCCTVLLELARQCWPVPWLLNAVSTLSVSKVPSSYPNTLEPVKNRFVKHSAGNLTIIFQTLNINF